MLKALTLNIVKSSQNFVDISIGNVSFYVTNPIVCQVYEGGHHARLHVAAQQVSVAGGRQLQVLQDRGGGRVPGGGAAGPPPRPRPAPGLLRHQAHAGQPQRPEGADRRQPQGLQFPSRSLPIRVGLTTNIFDV